VSRPDGASDRKRREPAGSLGFRMDAWLSCTENLPDSSSSFSCPSAHGAGQNRVPINAFHLGSLFTGPAPSSDGLRFGTTPDVPATRGHRVGTRVAVDRNQWALWTGVRVVCVAR